MEIGNYSVVHPSVKIGKNVTIGHHCVIQEGCEIGNDTKIEHFVLLKKETKIGDGCYIDSYVRSSGTNKIGNNVTLRFGSTIAKEVTVDDGAFISPNVMTIYSTHTGEKSPGTYIGKGVHVGTAAVIGPNVKLADGVIIGAMSYVNKDCAESGIYVGIPAKKRR